MKQYRIYIKNPTYKATFYVEANSKKAAIGKALYNPFTNDYKVALEDIARIVETTTFKKGGK